MIKKILKNKKSLVNITLESIENKMYGIGFNKEFAAEIMIILEKRLNEYGEKEFQEWFSELDFRIPEDFKDELLAMKIYDNHSFVIEEQVSALEKETKLAWEIQTEELKDMNEKARKAQLVIRHRLTEIALDLLD